MASQLFEFLEQLMIDTILIKLTQFEKTGFIGNIFFISQGNSKIKFHLRNKKPITFFVTFTLLLFDSGLCLPLSTGNELNLKRNQKSNRKKNIVEPEQTKIFPEKKKSLRPMSLNFVHRPLKTRHK